MSERSLNPEHYRRSPTVQDIYDAADEADRKYEAHMQRQLDDEAERERAQKEALELAQYGIGSTI